MKYMGSAEIALAMKRNAKHPVLSRATRFLFIFKNEVNEHHVSGWSAWKSPRSSAQQLMRLVDEPNATEADFKKSLLTIKRFYARFGDAVGMKYPEVL